jgi:hypothetical protein
MRTNLIHGTGIQGMAIQLNVCDMFAANQMADAIESVIKSKKAIAEYDKTPFDKRKEAFPEGRPASKELTDKQLEQLYTLLCKMSYSAHSTIFSDENEEWQNGADNDIDDCPTK